MRIAILSPIKLIGEGIAASLRACRGGFEPVVIQRIDELRSMAGSEPSPHLAIVDITQSTSLEPIRALHIDLPELPLVAFGIVEQEAEIISYGSAGFTGYLSQEDGLDQLRARVEDALLGRLLCSPEIAAGMMRGLFRQSWESHSPRDTRLTQRESDVARLIRRGLSNKEIARELQVSESTVKHHVHAILGKLHCGSRFQLAREAHETWDDAPCRALA